MITRPLTNRDFLCSLCGNDTITGYRTFWMHCMACGFAGRPVTWETVIRERREQAPHDPYKFPLRESVQRRMEWNAAVDQLCREGFLSDREALRMYQP